MEGGADGGRRWKRGAEVMLPAWVDGVALARDRGLGVGEDEVTST